MPRKDRRKIICWANNTIDESQTKGDRISSVVTTATLFKAEGEMKDWTQAFSRKNWGIENELAYLR